MLPEQLAARPESHFALKPAWMLDFFKCDLKSTYKNTSKKESVPLLECYNSMTQNANHVCGHAFFDPIDANNGWQTAKSLVLRKQVRYPWRIFLAGFLPKAASTALSTARCS